MKKIFSVTILFVLFPVLVHAYEVKGKAQSNFGAQQPTAESQDNAQTATAPATRSFTNYGSKQNWGKGVETKPVQTNLAGAQVTNFQPVATEVQTEKIKATVGASEQAPSAAPAANPSSTRVPTQATPQAAPATADMTQAAAAMQQLQGVQNMVGALMGGNGTPGKGNNPAQGAANAGSGTASSAGMPNLSALLNAANGAAATGGNSK